MNEEEVNEILDVYDKVVKELKETNKSKDKLITELQKNIAKVIEDLKNTLKYNMKHKDIRGNEYVDMDIDHIQMLIDMLEEIKNENI